MLHARRNPNLLLLATFVLSAFVSAMGVWPRGRSLAADGPRALAAEEASEGRKAHPGSGERARAKRARPNAGRRKFIQTFLIRIGGHNLKPGDEEQMAKYDVVLANKWHYDDIKGNTWKAIKSINPDTQIYLYVAAKSTVERDDAKPAVHLTNLGRYHTARGHSMGSLHGDNSDLFLRDRAGERIMTTYSNSFCVLDFGNPRFHAYAIEALTADFVGKPWTADGIFSDSLAAVKANVNAWPAAYDTDAKWAAAMNNMVSALSSGLHAAGQKFAVNREFTSREEGCHAWRALDQSPTPPDFVIEEGGFVVGWGPDTYATQFRDEKRWKRQLDLLGQIQHSHVGYANHTRLARGASGLDNHGGTHTYWDALWFALASFLVGKNDEANNSYFFFHGKSGYNLAHHYHDEYDRINLGRATSKYRVAKHGRANVYWREFEKGYVYVNPTTHAQVGLSLPERCKRLSHGNINEDPRTLADVRKIDLGAYRGAILVKTSALAVQEIAKTAQEYLAASPVRRAELEQELRSYKGPIEPVIRLLKPSSWKASPTGIIDFQTFTIPRLKAEYPDLVFHLYVPPHYDPQKPIGLFIFMHGGGVDNKAPWPLVYVKHRLRPEIDHASFITVAPLAPLVKSYNRWNVPQADDYIAAIITECSQRFHIDPDRVYLGGSSMGGIGAYHLCQRLCDRLAAGFAAAGRWKASDWRSLTGTPLFILHGVNDSYWESPTKYRDRMTDISYARYAAQLLDCAGVEHVYHESPGGHVWSNDEGRKGLGRFVEWVQTKRRDPFEKHIVAMTPKSVYTGPKSKDYADLTPRPSPHNRWLTILAIGTGKIRLNAHSVLQDSTYDSREGFAAYRSTLSTRHVRGGIVTGTLLDENRIKLQTENVRKLALWLHPDMLDFSKPVEVDINEHKQTVTCRPSLLDALRSYERRRDWGLIYHCKIQLDVPHVEGGRL